MNLMENVLEKEQANIDVLLEKSIKIDSLNQRMLNLQQEFKHLIEKYISSWLVYKIVYKNVSEFV
jgi:hypothetical protein